MLEYKKKTKKKKNIVYYSIDTVDWKFYIYNNKDLRDIDISTKEKAFAHYYLHGHKEKRPHRRLNKPEYTIDTFDWKFYLNRYKDLRDVGISTKEEAYTHWNTFGIYENRYHKKLDLRNNRSQPTLPKQIIINEVHKEIEFKRISENHVQQYTEKYNISYLPLNFDKKYKLYENKFYIISGDSNFKTKKNRFTNEINLFIVNGDITRDIMIYIHIKETTLLSLKEIIEKSTVYGIDNSILISSNQQISYIKKLFYLMGECKINRGLFGLESFYKAYDAQNNKRTYNKTIMLMCYYYYMGFTNLRFQNSGKIDSKPFYHKKNVLIISKLIKNTGGVQKTSIQLMEMLDHRYNVNIISVNMNKKKDFDFTTDYLSQNVPNNFIVKKKRLNDIVNYINNNNFEYIICNKLNEIFQLTDKINKKIQVICHNPKDIFNQQILDNQQYIDTCFVLTNYHKNLLIHNGFTKPLKIYHNYAFKSEQVKNKPPKKKKFTKNICFIGRLAKEKNLDLLINSFNDFNKIRTDIKLYIIGDGIKYTSKNPNIIFTGKLDFKEICDYLKICDYTISSSYIEGKPFSVVEGMSLGVPCIHSNIVGIDDIITENQTGFLFNFKGYDHVKFDFNFDFFDEIKKNDTTNKKNLVNVLISAYKIDIKKWNEMSNNCYIFSKTFFTEEYTISTNLKNIENKSFVNKKWKKYKIFINFKPDPTIPYGGGNISVFYIVREFTKRFSNFIITHTLESDIDIYLIIDVNKDRKFKTFGIEDIVFHRNTKNKHGKIIARINDCDITRTVTNITSREMKIKKFHNEINCYIYNSHFIKDYYLEKFKSLNFQQKNHCVIINGCDQSLFVSKKRKIKKKIKIVAHHWSSNLNKGYETYLKLWRHCEKSKDSEFIFIGKHVPNMFKEVSVRGPFVNKELVDALNECHVYITDSRYDSCPNHILEAISCGLPILYSNVKGGAKELCQMTDLPIGEMYEDFDDLLVKLKKIRDNYDHYSENLRKCKHIFKTSNCVNLYYNYIHKNCLGVPDTHFSNIKSKCIKIFNKVDDNKIITSKKIIKLSKGWNIFLVDDMGSFDIQKSEHDITFDTFPLGNKIESNDKLNILICADENYFCGVFALLQSVITNTLSVDKLFFNFILDINNCGNFNNMLNIFEFKNNVKINKLIVYIDINILDDSILNSKCFNGGGHLLNIGNLSRLLIGDIFDYEKIIYLDSDSIVQYDLYDRCNNMIVDCPMYAPQADRHSKDRSKNFVIRQKSIITCDYDWKSMIGNNINEEDYVFMGAPFVANCRLWKNIYKTIIDILKIHNKTPGGIFKLFTMSLQNIIFYKKTGNLDKVLRSRCDLGSKRRKWELNDLITQDVLDWSGMYKPWYENGLYKDLWEKYNILGIRKDIDIESMKDEVENGMTQKSSKPEDESDSNIDVTITPNIVLTITPNTNDYKIVDNYLNMENTEDLKDAEKYINDMSVVNNGMDNYSVLFVCDVKYLIYKMSRVRFWAIEELSKNKNINLDLLGPGFTHFDNKKTLQQNIIDQKKNYDIVIWYKPLDANYNFCYKTALPFKTMLRYNEMWDFEFTSTEIEKTKTDIIICHHKNDYEKYALYYKDDFKKTFYYNPHHANSEIFKPLDIKKEYDIMISGICKKKHYPLKYRLLEIIKKYKSTELKDYKIYIHGHPGYKHNDSFKSLNQKKYNEIVNKSTLCLACTSRHQYRLGKYVEIPMAGSVIVGDIPYEDKENFREFVVEVNIEDSELFIINKIKSVLLDKKELKNKIQKGIEWSKKYTTIKYNKRLIDIIDANRENKKIYIIADEIRQNHKEFNGQKWICDLLKEEFINLFPEQTTTNAKEADIIWYLAPWNSRHIPSEFTVKERFKFIKKKKSSCLNTTLILKK